MSSITNLGSHPFDITSDNVSLELFAEELPEQTQTHLSNCASSASSFSTTTGSSSGGSFSSVGSVISCG